MIRKVKIPPQLKEVYNPPKYLFYKGKLKCLQKTCISIVGTRKYSDYGEYVTNKLIEELKVLDIAIVSGLAKGIDTIAHKVALKNDIPTIAVLGSGLENIYPRENQKLALEIERKGLLLSEYEPEIEPINYNFPQRNRIISGLSVATIIIEAPEKSGALITARFALEQGREIFVVPGDIDRHNSKGITKLLQKGAAYPITSGQDIIEVLKIQPHLFPQQKDQEPQYNLTKLEAKIIDNMRKHRTIPLEEIAQKTAIQTDKLLATLSLLEIKGLILTKDGKYLRKC